jgi:hypothetical protein
MSQVASDWSDALKKLLDAYEQLGEALPLYSEKSLSTGQHHAQLILVRLYKSIFDFHYSAWQIFSRPGKL